MPFSDSPLYPMTNQSTNQHSTPDQIPNTSSQLPNDMTIDVHNTGTDKKNFGDILKFLGQGIGNFFGNIFGNKREKEARKYSKELYELQKKDQRQMIDEQNKYNSPSEQMKRLTEAGLSSHLMYGKGVTSQQPTSGTPPAMTQVAPLKNTLSFLTTERSLMELEYMREQIRDQKIKNEVAERTKEDQIKSVSHDQNRKFYETQEAILNVPIKQLEQDIALGKNGKSKANDLEIALKEQILSFNQQLNPQQVDELSEKIKNLKIDTDIKEQMLRAHTVQADMWSKGIKPNATLIEQYIDEVLYNIVNNPNATVNTTIEQLYKVPILGPIFQSIVENRRKEAESYK